MALHGQRFQALAEPFVWAIASVMVRALFMAGHDKVIVDATHTMKKRRDFWKSEDWEIVFHLVDTPPSVCLIRAEKEKDEAIIPVINRMSEQYEPLDDEERKQRDE